MGDWWWIIEKIINKNDLVNFSADYNYKDACDEFISPHIRARFDLSIKAATCGVSEEWKWENKRDVNRLAPSRSKRMREYWRHRFFRTLLPTYSDFGPEIGAEPDSEVKADFRHVSSFLFTHSSDGGQPNDNSLLEVDRIIFVKNSSYDFLKIDWQGEKSCKIIWDSLITIVEEDLLK